MAKPRVWQGEGTVSFRFEISGVKAKTEAQAAKLMAEIMQYVSGVNERSLKNYKGVFAMDESVPHVEVEFVEEEEDY